MRFYTYGVEIHPVPGPSSSPASPYSDRMTWIETTSLTFIARHEDGDTTYAEELLDRLEDLSLKLEDRFEVVPSQITVIVHPCPIWLTMAHPFLPARPLVGRSRRPPVPGRLAHGHRGPCSRRGRDGEAGRR